MDITQVLRWPSQIEFSQADMDEFKANVANAFFTTKLPAERFVVAQSQTELYIKPHVLKRGAMTKAIQTWHNLLYPYYRVQNFNPTDSTSLSMLHQGTVYCGMFPVDSEANENGFFHFKITGTFKV